MTYATIAQKLGMTTAERLATDHHEYYQKAIDLCGGYEKVKECVPYTLEEIQKAFPKDKYLNNLPMRAWDLAGGFRVVTTKHTEDYYPVNSLLRKLLKEAGVNCYSPSDGVCILKECARMMVERGVM